MESDEEQDMESSDHHMVCADRFGKCLYGRKGNSGCSLAKSHLEDYTDEEILRQFQYRTPELTKKALKVLEENQLNMYRPDSGYGDTEGESK